MRKKCTLTLSSGQSFEGQLIGAPLNSSGELVFTTGMVGYTEALTDPSYFGQILIFSYPLIGNYGIPEIPKELSLPIPRGFESARANVAGVIVTIDSPDAYHWNSFSDLDKWLKKEGVPGIVGLDTRHLVQLTRESSTLLGKVSPEGAEGYRHLGGEFTATDEYFDPGQNLILPAVSTPERKTLGNGKVRIGLVDCGVKWNIVRQLIDKDCTVEILPWDTDLSSVECDGWLLSNGPGDPMNTGDLIERVRGLTANRKPVLGICLGHQILSAAAGCKTKRMEYGHRSHNQPIYLVGTRKGAITSQNHGYVVCEDSLPEGWKPWFKNANDDTIEGIIHEDLPFRSVQFHPEAAGGPRDTSWIIEEFVMEVKKSCQ
jgi:carbamoyl-phosphate synthase small subunit